KEQAQRASDAHAGLLARIEQLERGLREQVEQSGNTLAAYIGELEDRLEKRGTPPAGG
ncbi:MAG: Signal transduction histidine kinase, partial [Proteobacteria bacterium]|nr:Signal transduction histidine kinase [Pseudomonadota bacterium]